MKQSVTEGVVSVFKAAREEAREAAEAAEAEKANKRGMAVKAINVDDMGVITFIGGAVGDVQRLDLDGEFIEKGDLLEMAFDFCAGAERAFDVNHGEAVKADLVQSWVGAPIVKDGEGIRVLKADEVLTNEHDVVGIATEKGAETHWFLSVRPHDPEIVEKAKKGDFVGGSWAASVAKKVVA